MLEFREYFFIYLLLGILTKSCTSEKTIEVRVKHGLVSGQVEKTFFTGKPYYSFKGIPYAEPPVGELRFKPPQAKQDWGNKVYEAKNNKPTCVQFCSRTRNGEPYGISGSEDCLYVNVFTPKLKESMAVLVFDYHDNFRTGFNGTDTYSPEFLPEEDVVVVTISHRLGLLGYLTTEDNVIPPNNGIRDYILALQWVKENIKSFGGDPDRVTLMGSKGGAVLANLLLYTEAAKGLFNAVTIQSGSAHEAIFFPEDPRSSAFKLGKVLNITAEDSATLLKELQSINFQNILEKEVEVIDDDNYFIKYQKSIHPFGPVIETNHPDAIIVTLPENGKIVNDVPVLIGFNSREGLDLIARYLFDPRSLIENKDNFFVHFPIRTNYRFDMNNSAFEQYKEEVLKFYLKDGYMHYGNILEYAVYVVDTLQNYALNTAVRKLSSELESPIFYYMFDFNGVINENYLYVLKNALSTLKIWGAGVTDELCYLHVCSRIRNIYMELKNLVSEQNEIKVAKKMIRLWANFAKTGNPTPDATDSVLKNFKWKPIDKSSKDLAYAHIKKTIKMDTNPLGKREAFWDTTLDKYSQMAVDGVAQKVEIIKDEL